MKVVDLSTDVAGRFAAKLFAMAGVSVHRPFQGESLDRTDDPLQLYLDAGKVPARLEQDAALAALLSGADLVFSSFDQGRFLGIAADRAALPDGCVEIVTSSFGLSGPYAGLRGGPLADWAAGGYLAITGEPDREPLIGPENLCGYITGYAAAIGAEAGLRARAMDGKGRQVDVSTMATMLGLHQSTFSRLAAGAIRGRTGRYAEVYPLTVLPCGSGYVSLGVVTDEEFDRLALAFGLPELVADPRFNRREARMDNRDALDAELAKYLEVHDADEVVATLQAHGVASATVVDARGVTDNPQLSFRNFWVSPAGMPDRTMPGNPIPASRRYSGHGIPEGTPRPRLRLPDHGRDSRHLPLHGLTVLDFTAFWAGPSATRCLADLGAEVIWVERPRSRRDFDDNLADPATLAQHLYHQKMHRHKRSVVLDLDSAAGRDAAFSLAGIADVMVENMSAGVATRLGIGPDKLCAAFPRLVYVSLSGYGHSGLWGEWRSYGPNLEAASSVLARTGYRGGPPMRMGHALPDGVGGLAGALAALRGLRERDETGRGGWFDISQLEVYTALSGEDVLAASIAGAGQPRKGNRSHTGAIQGVFRCRGEDQWIALRLTTVDDIGRFVAATGLSSLADMFAAVPRDDTGIERIIGDHTLDRDKHELALRLQQAGLEAVPVFTPDEIVRDPHVIERGIFTKLVCAEKACLLPANPVHSNPPLTASEGIAPRFGEHTAEVLEALDRGLVVVR